MAFVLTADLDWASEHCIAHFLAIVDRLAVKPTVFVTHESAAIRVAERDGRIELGVHPNFAPGSTHGDSIEQVLDHVMALAPEVLAVRCHRHICGPEIERALAARGLRIDSNTCRHLEPGIAPVALASGLLRLPVFFEDDVNWIQGRSWRFADHAAAFFSPGLKILNFHPFLVALNAPDAAFYQRHKSKIQTLDAQEAAELRHAGQGSESFLVEAISAIRAAGRGFMTLGALAAGLASASARPLAGMESVS